MSSFTGRCRGWLGVLSGLVLALVASAAPAPPVAEAHPLGSFTIDHYTALRTETDTVAVRYVVDFAEIPTFQEVQESGLVPEPGHPTLRPYLARRAEALRDGLQLEADGRRLALRVESSDIAFTPGAGGLPTMRVDVVYRAPLERAGDTVRLTYHDGNDAGRAGWREIVASAGARTALAETTAPRADVSRGLMEYPVELLQRPPQDVSARIVFTREVGAAPTVTRAIADRSASPAPADPAALRSTTAPPRSPAVASPPPATAARSATLRHAPVDASALLPAAAAPSAAVRQAPVDAPPLPATGVPSAAVPRGEAAWPRLPVAGAPSAVAPTPRPVVSAPVPATLAVDALGAPPPRRSFAAASALTELATTTGFGLGIAMSALAIAAGLGALHALEPGHGKTVVAAYLVGSRGTARHAVILGLVVTASHTAGVYLLGAATLYASRYVVPDRLYPWLAAGSGLAIAALGAVLFLRRLAGREIGHHHHGDAHEHGHVHGQEHEHDHGHEPGHAHEHGVEQEHHDHAHDYRHHDHDHAPDHRGVHSTHAHGHRHHHHAYPANVSVGHLLTLGVSGGIVPCPAALVVLLSAISLRRVGFGLLLVAAFSTGLAAVLVAIGILMVHARRLMARFTTEGPIIQRWLPLASSAAVAVFGVAITVQALTG